MRDLNVSIGTFEHEYNGVESSVIFDTRNLEGWKLKFIKRIVGNVLEISGEPGYRFTIEGNEEYQKFREYFGIGGGKDVFSIRDFVEHLNHQIPTEYRITDEIRKTILRYDNLIMKVKEYIQLELLTGKLCMQKIHDYLKINITGQKITY